MNSAVNTQLFGLLLVPVWSLSVVVGSVCQLVQYASLHMANTSHNIRNSKHKC